MRLATLLLLVLTALAAPPVADAQPAGGEAESPEAKLEGWDIAATQIQERLEAGDLTTGQLDAMRSTLEAQRAAIPKLVSATQSELEPLRPQLEALGPESDAQPRDAAPEAGPPPLPGLTLELPVDPADEPDRAPVETTAEVASERERLTTRIRDLEARLKLLNQADARAASLLSRIAELRRQNFTRKLLTRGPSPLEPEVVAHALGSLTSVGAAIVGETAARIAESRMDTPAIVRFTVITFLVIAAVLLLRGTRRALMRRLLRPLGPEAQQRPRAIAGIGATLVRLLLPALALLVVFTAAWNSGFLGPQGEMLLRGLAWTALVMIGAYAFCGAFYAPYTPELRLSRLSESETTIANRWLMALAAVVGLDRVLVVEGEALGLSIAALSLVNAVLLVLGGAAVWGYVTLLRPPAPGTVSEAGAAEEDEEEETPEERRETAIGPLVIGFLRLVARAVAVLAPLLALIGYFAASRFLFYPVVFSGAVIGFGVLLFHAVREAVDSVVLPAESEEPGAPSRIRMIPVLVGFLLICGAVPVLALIWGADTTDLTNAWRAFSAGFRVGEVTISPLDFFWFLLVFSVGYMLTRIVQGVLRRSVLPVTGLDVGGRAALSAGVFYLGVFLSALIAISATGLDLSNLALVAGALSVGIGFGLQNVVNNFVSGLILLLERPIKAGDWIQITSGMGYVKQIRVRSTEIETFDRQALIVPNSELISASVINWTHTNMQGRAIVPVHVAFATEPKKVEQVLMEIARAHPMVLRRPAPYVLFRRFGPDSLEFEIRAFLRDVNWILHVQSEMNFEIARRFAEEGIHIPYPQRDLHLRNTEEMARSIRQALDGDGAAAPESPEAPEPSEAPAPPRRRRRPSRPAPGPAPGDAGEGGGDADF